MKFIGLLSAFTPINYWWPTTGPANWQVLQQGLLKNTAGQLTALDCKEGDCLFLNACILTPQLTNVLSGCVNL